MKRSASSNFCPIVGKQAVLIAGEQREATQRAQHKEKYFVAYILPLMDKIFAGTGLVVVDSQNFPWLAPGPTDAKLKQA